MASDNTDSLLLVFLHGFRGSDTSFKDFPNRLKTILANTVKADVQAIVYPSYKTAGELKVAVEDFSAWLIKELQKVKQEQKGLHNNGDIMIVLLGHSMGGIVSAETILKFYDNVDDCSKQLLGAKIIGMLAYDTPFYSIDHNFVMDKAWSSMDKVNQVTRLWNTGAATITATTAARAITNSAHPTSNSGGSSGSKKWGLLAGVAGAAVLGAAAYLAKDKITTSVTDMYDQLTFISDLTDMNGCKERVKRLLEVPNISFKCFYVQLSPNAESNFKQRTFIKLPPEDTAYLFVPVDSPADNEIEAHTSLFESDRYYQLGSDSIALISEMIARHRRNKFEGGLTSLAL